MEQKGRGKKTLLQLKNCPSFLLMMMMMLEEIVIIMYMQGELFVQLISNRVVHIFFVFNDVYLLFSRFIKPSTTVSVSTEKVFDLEKLTQQQQSNSRVSTLHNMIMTFSWFTQIEKEWSETEDASVCSLTFPIFL